ncbi:MAG: hypothetical protein JO257_18080 [Deltaproteobacteria bacterium]|nr:hypothetical protein [Deltaproteobacteria bacterium]
MALKDSEMQAVSIFGTGVLVAALFAPVLVFANAGSGPAKPDNLVAIEASIAYSKTPQKQPQKKIKAPDEVKPEGVNRDENKKPDDKKPDDKKDKKPDLSDLSKFKHSNDDDTETGKPTTDPGKFNGNENGYAEETKGDPWLGKLRGDMQYSPPEIAKGNDAPIGCIHLTADGKIVDSKWIKNTGDDLQTAAEAAIDQLKKTRNANPDPVPTHLLSLTTRWLCFKFTVSSQ